MKKLFVLLATITMLLSFAAMASAENAVSLMAVEKGGSHIAECARMMDKGVSECAQMDVCNHSM